MEKQIIKKQVKKILGEKYLQDTNLKDNDDLLELGIDSIKIIELVIDLETEFNFEFADEKLSYETLYCIDNIVSYIHEEMKEK